MKKSLQTIAFALLSMFANAQNNRIANFEDLPVPADSFIDGRYLQPHPVRNNFISEFLVFTNTYDTSFNYFRSGFAISTKADSITEGYGNLYSSITGSGHQSTHYAVANNRAVIISPVSIIPEAPKGVIYNGLYVNNSAYAYYSMLKGDMFGKKFGGPSGNDPDWFKLNIVGYFNDTPSADTVSFYLADFRDSVNTNDYILKQWTWIDLTTLGKSDSLAFFLSSSDQGQFGMNTPAFFCVDGVSYQNPLTGINTVVEPTELTVYPNPTNGLININCNTKITQIKLTDLKGKVVFTGTDNSIDISALDGGIYFINAETSRGLLIRKVVKN